jgi:hypothetical protein
MKEYTEGSENITFLDDNVIVFHNVLSDPDDYIDYYEEFGKWRGWYGFGRQIDSRVHSFRKHPTFPTWDEWLSVAKEAIDEGEDDKYFLEVAEAFHLATKFYINHTGRVLPNWTCQPWGLARYIPDQDLINSSELTMNYHTDYMTEDSESPGEKFGITAVLYPNDDYEGGEICFRIVGEEGLAKEFCYKPKAGDLVVFPSNPPYYHGVKRINGAPKYITRLYWMYDFEGTSTWHTLKNKYGDKFEDLELERRKRTDLWVMQPYMKQRFTLEEYYSLLDSGELQDSYSEQEAD